MSQYSAPGYYTAPNPLATWALVLGIASICLSPFIIGGVIGVFALVLGIVAARRQSGKGAAIVGIVLAALAISVAAMVGLFVFSIHRAIVAHTAMPGSPVEMQIIAMKVALDRFEVDNDRYPTTAEGLAALKSAPPSLTGTWHGPYLDAVPDDPWGHPYIYHSPGAAGVDTYDITSKGPDGKPGTKDDITQSASRP